MVDIQDEEIVKEKINEIENRALREQLQVIMEHMKVTRQEAYNLLIRYREIWEFTGNVSSSGKSLTITLPKKEAKEQGIEKGSPVFVEGRLRSRSWETQDGQKRSTIEVIASNVQFLRMSQKQAQSSPATQAAQSAQPSEASIDLDAGGVSSAGGEEIPF